MTKLLNLAMVIGLILIMLASCEGMPLWKNMACALVGFPLVIIPMKKLGWLL